jgi:hypothetical protein
MTLNENLFVTLNDASVVLLINSPCFSPGGWKVDRVVESELMIDVLGTLFLIHVLPGFFPVRLVMELDMIIDV